MRLTRPALAVAVLSALALTMTGADAAAPPKPVSWTDISGDGNGLNGQVLSGGPGDTGTATPGSQAGMDVVKAELANTYVKVGKKVTCSGFTATMTLTGPPAANAHYRIQGVTETNPLFVIFEYDTADHSEDIRYGTSTTDDNTISFKKSVKVVGNKIVFTLTQTDFKAIGEKNGSRLETMDSSVSASVAGALFLPVIDKAPAPDTSSFKFCG
ncbi:MAG: hypothetical protein JWM40_651 [Frankiales bacterium]|nr:hypothetical protein [Frankiales bacterium]